MKDNKIPVIDDEDLRKKQIERFTEGMGALGDYAKSLKTVTKINAWTGFVWIVVILLIIGGGSSYAVYSAGGIDGIFDISKSTRWFNCTSDYGNDSVRTYDEAYRFTQIFDGDCIVYHKNRGENND